MSEGIQFHIWYHPSLPLGVMQTKDLPTPCGICGDIDTLIVVFRTEEPSERTV